MQNCSIAIDNALEILQSCIKPLVCNVAGDNSSCSKHAACDVALQSTKGILQMDNQGGLAPTSLSLIGLNDHWSADCARQPQCCFAKRRTFRNRLCELDGLKQGKQAASDWETDPCAKWQ